MTSHRKPHLGPAPKLLTDVRLAWLLLEDGGGEMAFPPRASLSVYFKSNMETDKVKKCPGILPSGAVISSCHSGGKTQSLRWTCRAFWCLSPHETSLAALLPLPQSGLPKCTHLLASSQISILLACRPVLFLVTLSLMLCLKR